MTNPDMLHAGLLPHHTRWRLDRSAPSLDLPGGATELLEARERARAAKEFARADQLRDALAAIGVVVTDTPEGQRWKVGAKNVGRTSRPGPTTTP